MKIRNKNLFYYNHNYFFLFWEISWSEPVMKVPTPTFRIISLLHTFIKIQTWTIHRSVFYIHLYRYKHDQYIDQSHKNTNMNYTYVDQSFTYIDQSHKDTNMNYTVYICTFIRIQTWTIYRSVFYIQNQGYTKIDKNILHTFTVFPLLQGKPRENAPEYAKALMINLRKNTQMA